MIPSSTSVAQRYCSLFYGHSKNEWNATPVTKHVADLHGLVDKLVHRGRQTENRGLAQVL